MVVCWCCFLWNNNNIFNNFNETIILIQILLVVRWCYFLWNNNLKFNEREEDDKNLHFECVYVCVCVCVCVCLCVCVCVCTSIHREGFICLVQLGYQGTDQRCYVKDVNFLCQVPSSLLQNAAPTFWAEWRLKMKKY